MPTSNMESLETCLVCHEAFDIYAVGNCDHPICYRCSTRMRTLCDQMYCPICRTDLSQVYMIRSLKKYSEIPRHGYIQNRRFKIFFEDNAVQKKYEKILEHRCLKCNQTERTLKALQTHLRQKHTLFYCDLCIDHLKIFTSERKVYNRTELAQHRRLGDKDDSSYKGHPLCHFCDERYMDNDELYRHLRKDHFFCHFCESDGNQDFYSEYTDLKDHFRAKHYLCEEGECHDAQFTNAFRSRIDFQAHKSSSHSKNMSKSEAKQARTIDVNIQLAPRSRHRDRGKVTKDDYDETAQHRQRTTYNRERTHKERFREEDIEQAIQASLTVMKEDNTKKNTEQRNSPVPDVIKHDNENFPTIGNIAAASLKPLRPDSPADSDHRDSDNERSVKTLAKHLSLKNSQSVQHGAMDTEDFPSLSMSSSSATNVTSSLPFSATPSVTVANVLKPKTDMVKSAVKNNFSNVSKSAGLVQEDFPGLPSAKSKALAGQVGGPWGGKKPTPTQGRSSPAPQVVINNRSNNSDNERPKSVKPKVQKVARNLNDDNDFPSLGGKATETESVGWLKVVKDTNNKKVKDKKPIDWFEMDNGDSFSIDNLKGDKNNPSLIESANNNKNKKKKKKKTKNDDSDSVNSDSKISGMENASLDSIASSVLMDNTKSYTKSTGASCRNNTESENIPSAKASSEGKRNETASTKVPKVEDKCLIGDVAASQVVQSETKMKSISHPISAPSSQLQNGSRFLSLEQEDELALKEEEFVKVKPKSQKKVLPSAEDFPSLSSTQGSKAPPPGFPKPEKKKAPRQPPGFGDSGLSTAGNRPPPGFQAGPSEIQTLTESEDIMSNALKGLNLRNMFPVETDLKKYEYAQPEKFQSRNQKLIADIKECFSHDQDKFEKFKFLSLDFRQGSIEASEYYKKCEELMGSQSFKQIFSELLVLLPDIQKQQELLTAHNKFDLTLLQASKVLRIGGKAKDSPWSKDTSTFQSCPTCRQVLLANDYSNHLSTHNVDNDFPTLGGQNTVTTGPGMRGWVKAK